MATISVLAGNAPTVTAYSEVAAIATPTVTRMNTPGFRGAIVIIDLTAFDTAASITPTIRGFDPVSGKTWDILVGPAIVALSEAAPTVLRVHPDLTATTNVIAKDVLPPNWEIVVTHNNANSHTYTVSAQLIP